VTVSNVIYSDFVCSLATRCWCFTRICSLQL